MESSDWPHAEAIVWRPDRVCLSKYKSIRALQRTQPAVAALGASFIERITRLSGVSFKGR
jgi:hypothetical protein